jgi:hypothetical protein
MFSPSIQGDQTQIKDAPAPVYYRDENIKEQRLKLDIF